MTAEASARERLFALRAAGVGEGPLTVVLEAQELAERADADPRRGSWLPWVARSASRNWRAAHRAAAEALRVHSRGLIRDAAALARRGQPELEPWQQPDVDAVAQILARFLPGRGHSTTEELLRALYADALLQTNPEDLELVCVAADAYAPPVRELLEYQSYSIRPHELGMADDERLVEFANSPGAVLPRAVTVWRGERPSSNQPGFVRAARAAQPGDILERGLISVSLSPAIAAAGDFCQVPLITAPRTGADGWILRLSVDRLLYAGSRDVLLGRTCGQAGELEAFVNAPRLIVRGVFEGLVDTDWGYKRVRVIDATPANYENSETVLQ